MVKEEEESLKKTEMLDSSMEQQVDSIMRTINDQLGGNRSINQDLTK